jgi:hypothetical protein
LFVEVLGRGAQVVARGAARCASQVLGRGARDVTRGTVTLIAVRKGATLPHKASAWAFSGPAVGKQNHF